MTRPSRCSGFTVGELVVVVSILVIVLAVLIPAVQESREAARLASCISTPSAAATGPIKYGPSSDRSAVTNHLSVDGSVHAISNEIDAALYMFMMTRNGGDPMPGYEVEW
ncbi:MAG: hypothetical protein A2V70_20780 [Planctomycetes bacterium RBG_13_63_9]|nr:MAG: hypothetical protein A2V70_20780 [Planctomycetes bacterium RBG_13_63_9]